MKKIAFFFFGLIIYNAFYVTVKAQSPRLFLIDAKALATIKQKLKQNDSAAVHWLNSLTRQADKLLNTPLVSVMDKGLTPVSGNKHDYMSQAPYFWYDSSKPNGLPYLRKDGERNPEINKITDHIALDLLDNKSRTLSLAWYITGDEKYATKATTLLRHWFIDTAYKMNPNLNYAQGIPGINDGRGIGLIETRALTGIADVAGLLANSKSWTASDAQSLQQWYVQFLDWMLTSKNGKEEHAAKNNHGTWYYVQAVDFALFTGNGVKAKELVIESKTILDSQITKEGKMPLELERTNALSYSTFNLEAWYNLATLADKVGIDLWNYKNPRNSSIQTALDWLLPYAYNEKPWTYQQIGKYDMNELYSILTKAAAHYDAGKYLSYRNKIARSADNYYDF